MPTSAAKACHQPGCRNTTRRGAYCDEHRMRRGQQRRDNDASVAFYKTQRWRKFRAWFLAHHPLCVHCRAEGRITAAQHVDHKLRRRERPDLEFDEGNCQALCHSCHSRKTIRERYGGRATPDRT